MAQCAAIHVVSDLVHGPVHAVLEGVRPRILSLVESRAVILIGAGFKREADGGTGAMAILRIHRILLNVHLLNHIRGGYVSGLVSDADRGPVYLQVRCVILAAAHGLMVRAP